MFSFEFTRGKLGLVETSIIVDGLLTKRSADLDAVRRSCDELVPDERCTGARLDCARSHNTILPVVVVTVKNLLFVDRRAVDTDP